MDLAKIRKKSLSSVSAPEQGRMIASAVITGTPAGAVEPAEQSVLPVPCSPLEAILAFRHAAGCGEAEKIPGDDTLQPLAPSFLELLCFRVSHATYGIDIMKIKEIIMPRAVTEVPRSPYFVTGVISLRGTMLPITDLRIRLGLERVENAARERIIVIKNHDSLSGLLVDEVIQVLRVRKDTVEAAPVVLEGTKHEFICGLCRSGERLIRLLNIENCVDFKLL